MQLKKLQLVGFKTFADKTEIEIGDGLTCVVGPNGSGKSNIADAILWVMGEQNPRLLRGAESRDVIFAGTDKRKPLGMAEVKLTVDNSDRSLPIDFAEVAITRRVYRSGESQYLLNNSPCRLKDIVELFLDTGVGKGAYGFVSQNEIDAVLSARPEDRRELFEEAAGIKKYRVKKREAVRKLEQAEANLNRVRDIVYELEQQREPLAEQATQARRFLELTERLQQIEVDLLIAELKKSDYELYSARQECDLDQEAIRKFDSDLAVLERESESIGGELAQAEQESEIARIAHQSAHSAVERTESQLQLVSERGASAEQSADSLDEEIRHLADRMLALSSEIEVHQKALDQLTVHEQSRLLDRTAARAKLSELETALHEAERASQDRHGMLLRLVEQRAQRESALNACRARLTETLERLARLEDDLKAAGAQLEAAQSRLQTATNALARSREDLARAAGERASLEGERNRLRDRESQARTSLDSARRLLAERSSRLATLTELQEAGEGFFQGVRSVLQAQKRGDLSGFYAPAVDLITVPDAYRTAIEVALGGSLQDVVCETEPQAKAAIEWLKEHRGGRATFLALPLLRPAPRVGAAPVSKLPGLVGVACDLVAADKRFAIVVELLLGRVIVADDLQGAIDASKRLESWSRIVTLQGELITPGGAMTGGSLQGKGSHLVGRKGEIDDLSRDVPLLQSQVKTLATDLVTATLSLAGVDRHISDASRQQAEFQVSQAAREGELSSARRDSERFEASIRDLNAEAARMNDASQTLREEEARWVEITAAAKSEDTGADEAIAAAQVEAERLAAVRDKVREETTKLEVECGRLSEKRMGLERELQANRKALEEDRTTLSAKQIQRELAGAQFADARSMQSELERRLNEAREQFASSTIYLDRWRDRRQELLNLNFDKTDAIKRIINARSSTLQEMHDAELRIARLEVKLAQTGQRLLDEYAISIEEGLARPDPVDMDRATVNEISRLRREIRAMGQVNTGAVEEYNRLTERHDFLAGQRADLVTARESLLATISEIDESTRDVFMSTFNAVSDEFSSIFRRLFSGGTTRLVLTLPDDLLETGIEVIAQPPGKKAQHLSLLSGGERALTAVALLFSFLAVRPSPFCLLDEVDAPLDGANVEKFVQLVQDFSRNTQFVVITHNPTTMEAAPRWYGVTMQEPGISRILSYRMPAEAVVSEPMEAVAAGNG